MIKKHFIMNDGYVIWGPILLTESFLFILLYKEAQDIFILFLLSGVLLFIYGFIFLYKIKKTFSWKKLTANIVSIDKNKIIILEPGVQDITYQPKIKYKYCYKGNDYINEVFSIISNDYIFRNKQGISAKDALSDFLNLFILDRNNITIWVNPNKASESILQQGAEKKTIYKYMIIFYLGCVNIGTALLFLL